jgi:hypothetical protein
MRVEVMLIYLFELRRTLSLMSRLLAMGSPPLMPVVGLAEDTQGFKKASDELAQRPASVNTLSTESSV